MFVTIQNHPLLTVIRFDALKKNFIKHTSVEVVSRMQSKVQGLACFMQRRSHASSPLKRAFRSFFKACKWFETIDWTLKTIEN